MLWDSPMRSPYLRTWDPMGESFVDRGWIGTGPDGVWLRVHPEVALANRPHLEGAVARFLDGFGEVTREDYDTLAACEILALRAMDYASKRQQQRRAEHGRQQGGN